MERFASRPSFSDVRREKDNVLMLAVGLVSWLSFVTILNSNISDDQMYEGNDLHLKSELVVALPPNQREALNAIEISDKGNGKGSKPVSPQKLHQNFKVKTLNPALLLGFRRRGLRY